LGSSLPPAELTRWDSGVLVEMKCSFSFTPEVGRSGEVAEEFSAENQVIDAGFAGVGRWTQRLVLNPSSVVLARCIGASIARARDT
jgi:hypothetical protein